MSRDQRHIVKQKKPKRRINHVNYLGQHNLHNQNKMICPYCGAEVILKRKVEIKNIESDTYLYVCTNYPICDSYVTTHQDSLMPQGSVANRSLRDLRIKTHYYFDMLHNKNIMKRGEAYKWMAITLCIPFENAHIGYLKDYQCKYLITKCIELLTTNPRTQNIKLRSYNEILTCR